jgi:hypothetical protein
MRLEGLGQLKNSTSSGLEPAAFRVVAYCLNQLLYRVPQMFYISNKFKKVQQLFQLSEITSLQNNTKIWELSFDHNMLVVACDLISFFMPSLLSATLMCWASVGRLQNLLYLLLLPRLQRNIFLFFFNEGSRYAYHLTSGNAKYEDTETVLHNIIIHLEKLITQVLFL